jgi:hypothetical protein
MAMKHRPDQKQEAALDQALADTFPASDPIALIQPSSAGAGWRHATEPKPVAPASQSKKDISRGANF